MNGNIRITSVRIFASCTGKHTEGDEAGDTGLALAAEAFRKTGDMTRCRFTERLICGVHYATGTLLQYPPAVTEWRGEQN